MYEFELLEMKAEYGMSVTLPTKNVREYCEEHEIRSRDQLALALTKEGLACSRSDDNKLDLTTDFFELVLSHYGESGSEISSGVGIKGNELALLLKLFKVKIEDIDLDFGFSVETS